MIKNDNVYSFIPNGNFTKVLWNDVLVTECCITYRYEKIADESLLFLYVLFGENAFWLILDEDFIVNDRIRILNEHHDIKRLSFTKQQVYERIDDNFRLINKRGFSDDNKRDLYLIGYRDYGLVDLANDLGVSKDKMFSFYEEEIAGFKNIKHISSKWNSNISFDANLIINEPIIAELMKFSYLDNTKTCLVYSSPNPLKSPVFSFLSVLLQEYFNIYYAIDFETIITQNEMYEYAFQNLSRHQLSNEDKKIFNANRYNKIKVHEIYTRNIKTIKSLKEWQVKDKSIF